jgi:hypothetical protein
MTDSAAGSATMPQAELNLVLGHAPLPIAIFLSGQRRKHVVARILE